MRSFVPHTRLTSVSRSDVGLNFARYVLPRVFTASNCPKPRLQANLKPTVLPSTACAAIRERISRRVSGKVALYHASAGACLQCAVKNNVRWFYKYQTARIV